MPSEMGERIAVLVSGNGTNLQALLDDPFCGPRVSFVLSDRPGCEPSSGRWPTVSDPR